MKNKLTLFLLLAITAWKLALGVPVLWAQAIRDNAPQTSEGEIPLKRIVILTSGLAYYEYSGTVNGTANIGLSFRLDSVNDALKTLVINDPASANPSVTYQSEQTLIQTLHSLQINLSDNPGLDVILSRLRGAEVEITAIVQDGSAAFNTGRIVGVEHSQAISLSFMHVTEPSLILSTSDGIKSFKLSGISSIKFLDSSIEDDMNRALDLIAASRNSLSRQLMVNLPGNGRRDVSISYVIPSPVWKVSYRLDLGASRPLFQGWAIVDNDSDKDWNNVTLSLVAGRPASFIQNLYPPYYVARPVLPLSIAGAAEARVHDRGYGGREVSEDSAVQYEMADQMYMSARSTAPAPAAGRVQSNVTGGTIETAAGSAAGGQFEFTIRTPVSLDRQMSAMLPLVESQIEARSLLIYNGGSRHPRLGAEITNSSGMKLPAGPVTVYDGGVYAGDALLEFWNEDEKRLISFGEDLSVTISDAATSDRTVSTVVVSGGVMTINRRMTHTKTYTIINSGSAQKLLVVEHNKTAESLVSPNADEQTATAYRFNVNLPANRETIFAVTEQSPLSERITLLSLRPDVILSYSTNQEIPQRVRDALQRAVELRREVDTAEQNIRNIEAQRGALIADQDRIRRNLEAAGSQTQQGQDYLNRMATLDSEIDALTPNLERANANARAAHAAYENYLTTLNLQ